MSKPDKAKITFDFKGKEVEFRFHAVIAEDHEVSSEITKYPVQAGFNVSNHAIKRNRRVSIKGVITNNVIEGSETGYKYGTNNVKVMFNDLQQLVTGAVPCKVTTGYGEYSPVIFTKFSTGLKAGLTDSMEFTISGEEVRVSSDANSKTPVFLSFENLEGPRRDAVVAKLVSANIDVPEGSVISQAKVDLNNSFSLVSRANNGDLFTSTYIRQPYDFTSGIYSYLMHTSDTDLVGPQPQSSMNWFEIMKNEAMPDTGLLAGANTSIACLKDGAVRLARKEGSDYINTSVGELKKSIYGAAYGIVGVNGDRGFGQVIASLGADCLVAGAIGSVDPDLGAEDFKDHSLPNLEEIIKGARKQGNSIATLAVGEVAPTTLTKITRPESSNKFFSDLL